MSREGWPPFNYDDLGSVSKRLASVIFAAKPELRQYAWNIQSNEADGLSLYVDIPSPTEDSARDCEVWVDEVSTPSIGFGPTHTHETPDDVGCLKVVDLLSAIFDDELVIIEDVGGAYPGHGSWIDLRNPEALEEELTSRHSPGRALLKSWTGKGDREVSTESLPQ